MKSVTKTAFLDIVLLIAISFVTLSFLAFLLIQPPTKKSDVEKKAIFLVVLDWENDSPDDIDLWIKTPSDKIIYFMSKENGVLYLDRDDRGIKTDTVTMPDGRVVTVKINREVISIRGIVPGEYVINIHAYEKNESGPTTASVEVIQLNPYKIRYKNSFIMENQGQEEHVVRFTLTNKNQMVNVKPLSDFFANKILYNNMESR